MAVTNRNCEDALDRFRRRLDATDLDPVTVAELLSEFLDDCGQCDLAERVREWGR